MRKIKLLAFIAPILVSVAANAVVPREFSVQGILRNNQGALQSLMMTNVIVTLYDAETGGNTVGGPYTATGVAVTNGLFTVRIQDAQLASKIVTPSDVWVELSVGNDTFPRTKMSTQPYALLSISSESADTLSSKCSGCVVDAMIGGVSAAKVSGKVAAAMQCDSAANATNATNATSATNATTATTATNATQLGGTAAATFQALLNTSCGAGKYVQGIGANGVPACGSDANSGGTVTSVSAVAPLSISNATTTPAISLGTVGSANGGTGISSFSAGTFLRASAANTWAAASLSDGDIPGTLSGRTFNSPSIFNVQGAFAGSGTTLGVSTSTVVLGSTTADFSGGGPGVGRPNAILFFPGSGWTHGYLTYYPHPSAATSHAAFEISTSQTYYGDNVLPADLYVNGSVNSQGNVSRSDVRLKEKIAPLKNAMEALEAIPSVTFRWKSDGRESIGFIAQDVEKVFPQLVEADRKGYKGVAYGNMVAVVAQALKEEHARTGRELARLEAENVELRARLQRLEKVVANLGDAPRDKQASLR
jgi:hypothetical protein